VSQVGFVGAGRMGAPMVRRLVEAGHQVRALEVGREAQGRQRIRCPAVTDLADVGADADVVIVCVFTDDQVRQGAWKAFCCPRCDQGPCLSSTPPAAHGQRRRSPPRPRSRGVGASTHRSAAAHRHRRRTGDGVVGGATTPVEQVHPVLASYGDPILHVGPIGAGQGVKLVNNTLFAAQIGLLHEAVRLGDSLGIDRSGCLTLSATAARRAGWRASSVQRFRRRVHRNGRRVRR